MKSLLLFFAFVFSLQAFSQTYQIQKQIVDDLQSDETYKYPDYYKVKEDPRLQNINLLVLQHVENEFPRPDEAYNRKKQFGTWIRDRLDGTCMDTRGKVLVRDSQTTVSYRSNGCTVDSGDWDDPYSGRQFKSAAEIQIDHFVPLKNAYMTGGFEWDSLKRCLYANYMGNEFHLLPVSSGENQRKSDSTPSKYMPSARAYACTYLKQWLEVKTIWTLRITPKEAKAIQMKIADNRCDETQFLIPTQFVTEQRRYMSEHADLCK